jgi:hypothetical protein
MEYIALVALPFLILAVVLQAIAYASLITADQRVRITQDLGHARVEIVILGFGLAPIVLQAHALAHVLAAAAVSARIVAHGSRLLMRQDAWALVSQLVSEAPNCGGWWRT